MRAELRRPKITAFRVPDLPGAAHHLGASAARRGPSAPRLRLVPPAPSEHVELGTALRLFFGFAAIAGFVAVGLWVEFGALERVTYLVSSLGLFSLYGAATWVPRPRAGSGRGR